MRDAFRSMFHRYANIELFWWPCSGRGYFAALLVFRISMAPSEDRPAHVLRCVVYSSEHCYGSDWSAQLFSWLAALTPAAGPCVYARPCTTAAAIGAVFCICSGGLCRRTAVPAFRPPGPEVLASQVIAGLAILKIIAASRSTADAGTMVPQRPPRLPFDPPPRLRSL